MSLLDAQKLKNMYHICSQCVLASYLATVQCGTAWGRGEGGGCDD